MEIASLNQPSWMGYLPLAIASWLFVCVVLFSVSYVRARRRGNPFPELDQSQILFEEKGVSGNSNKSFFTMLGGASGILWVTVTRDEVWIRPRPYTLFLAFGGERSDLIHRIPRSRILSVTQEASRGKDRVALQFVDHEDKSRFFFLYLRRPDDFLRATRAG